MQQSTLSLIILGVIIICFVTRIIPLGITAVAGAIAMSVTGIITFGEAFAAFGSDTVVMILGMMVIGHALAETGATDIIGEKLTKISWVTKTEKRFLIIVLTVVALISGFMSNTATVSIFLPLIASVAKNLKGKITKKNTYMAVGISSIIGGNLTLAGSTPQIVAQGILEQTEGCRSMTLFELSKGAIPLIIVMLLYFGTIGYSLQKKAFDFEEKYEIAEENSTETVVKKDKAIICVVVFLFCIVGFVFDIFTLGTIAAIGACVCIATKCISIKRAVENIDWTSILVLGGSMGFSKGLDKSGALEMLAKFIVNALGPAATAVTIMSAFLILAAIISNIMSNTATTAVLAPIAITIATNIGSNPILFAIAVVIGCNLAFTTPVSTPPLTMTLVGGYRFKDYVKVGGLLNIICVIVALITLPLLYGV